MKTFINVNIKLLDPWPHTLKSHILRYQYLLLLIFVFYTKNLNHQARIMNTQGSWWIDKLCIWMLTDMLTYSNTSTVLWCTAYHWMCSGWVKFNGVGICEVCKYIYKVIRVKYTPFHPKTFLANSITATCIPRQTPVKEKTTSKMSHWS